MLNTERNRRRLQQALRSGEPLVIDRLTPDPDEYVYDREQGAEICIVPHTGTATTVLVSADLRYRGHDSTKASFFEADPLGNGWRPTIQVASRDATEILRSCDELLANFSMRSRSAKRDEPKAKIVLSADDVSDDDQEPCPVDRFGIDLVKLARDGQLDEVIGRESEVESLIRIVAKYGKNGACLVGEPGVGKSATVEKLALRIARNEVPESLRGLCLYDVNLGFLAAGASFKNEFEARFKALLDRARARPDTILFFDEVHQLVSPQNDVSQMVKADLGRGRIRCIGATTNGEWRRIEADPALARRFQVIPIKEPTPAESLAILKRAASRIGEHHDIEIPEELLEEIVTLSIHFVGDRRLPDKAIDLLDEAAALRALRATGNSGRDSLRPNEKYNRASSSFAAGRPDRVSKNDQAPDGKSSEMKEGGER